MKHIQAAKSRIEDLWAKGTDYDTQMVDEARKQNLMLHLDLDLTGNCKLKCFYCDRTPDRFNKEPEKVELTFEERKSVILQAKHLGATTIEFPGAGEPMIDEHFWDIIEYIHSLDMISVLFTSGYHLDEVSIDRLFKNNVTIFLKYNSADAEVQDKMVGVKGYAAKSKVALQMLVDKGFSQSVPTRMAIDMVVTPQFHDMDGVEELIRWCRNNNVHNYIMTLIPEGRADSKEVILAKEHSDKMIQRLREIDEAEYGLVYKPSRPMAGGYKCRQVNVGLFVNLFGEVYDCNGLGRFLGHIRLNTIEEIWNAKFAKQIRKPIQDGFCLLRERVWEGVESSGMERKLEQYQKYRSKFGEDQVVESGLEKVFFRKEIK